MLTPITEILRQIDSGDMSAADRLLPVVYEELRKLASAKLASERSGQTLQATGLVHEAYLRLVSSSSGSPQWNGSSHFFGAAAEAMRRILVDRARQKRRVKHGGDRRRVDLEDIAELSDDRADELLALEVALERLEIESQEKAQLVKLRYFAGLSHQEAAAVMGLSRATADRYWAYARAFLRSEMTEDNGP